MPFSSVGEPVLWQGRYLRIPGNEPAYHVTVAGQVELRWQEPSTGEMLRAPTDDSEVLALGEAVCKCKKRFGGYCGGSFLINEFGQVFCPVRGSYDRFLVGEWHGDMGFINPNDPLVRFTLNPTPDFRLGQPWPWPYVGFRYNLTERNEIVFRFDNTEGREWIRCPAQDTDLIQKLRKIRPWGTIRFIVNHYRAVFCKRERNGVWEPVYVGRINYHKWFSKEKP